MKKKLIKKIIKMNTRKILLLILFSVFTAAFTGITKDGTVGFICLFGIMAACSQLCDEMRKQYKVLYSRKLRMIKGARKRRGLSKEQIALLDLSRH